MNNIMRLNDPRVRTRNNKVRPSTPVPAHSGNPFGLPRPVEYAPPFQPASCRDASLQDAKTWCGIRFYRARHPHRMPLPATHRITDQTALKGQHQQHRATPCDTFGVEAKALKGRHPCPVGQKSHGENGFRPYRAWRTGATRVHRVLPCANEVWPSAIDGGGDAVQTRFRGASVNKFHRMFVLYVLQSLNIGVLNCAATAGCPAAQSPSAGDLREFIWKKTTLRCRKTGVRRQNNSNNLLIWFDYE
jgi:hypothetical protein